MEIPLENYYHRCVAIMSNICASGADNDKSKGIKHDRRRVGITKPEIAGMLRDCPKLICQLCQTPIKIWVMGGMECISCDRHIDPSGLYKVGNIQFTHQKCNTVEGPWRRHGKSRENTDFRNMLTEAGVIWCEPDSSDGMKIFSKNEEYFRLNTSEQKKLETKPNMKDTTTAFDYSTDISVKLDGQLVEGKVIDLARFYLAIAVLKSVHSVKGNVTTASKQNSDNTLTGRVRSYIWSLPNNTPLNLKLLQKSFTETLPTGMLSDLMKNTAMGVCLRREVGAKRGEYLSVRKEVTEDLIKTTVTEAVKVAA